MNDLEKADRSELVAEITQLRERIDSGEDHDLVISEAKYRALVEGSSDFIYVLDKDGRFTFANREVENLLGYESGEIVGRHFSEVLHPDDIDSVGRSFHERRTGERATKRLEVRLRSSGGDTRDVELDIRHFALSASGLYKGEDFVGTHGVARDITERKYLARKNQALHQVREAIWSMVHADDILKVLEAIRAGLETIEVPFSNCGVQVLDMGEPPMMYSYSSFGADTIAKRGEWMIADVESLAGSVSEIWQRGKPVYFPDLDKEVNEHERQRLTQLHGPARALLEIPFSHGVLTVNSALPDPFSERDLDFSNELAEAISDGFRRVEDLQQLTLSEKRYRTLVETPNFIVMLLDPEGNYLYVSPQIEDWLGYSAEEFYRDPKLRQQIVHEDDITALEEFLQFRKKPIVRDLQYRWRNQSGEFQWASSSLFPIFETPEDELVNRVGMIQMVVQDITERKLGEQRIQASLSEKEVLLKEIHHRVKNNLQIISSLLHLQSQELGDAKSMNVFSDSQHRIESMSLIHEELYKSADLARVDFAEYMSNLTENLFDSYGVVADQVALGIDVEAPPLDIDKAIPLGLIVNELVSNSLKYAFPESGKGTVAISLNRSESGGFVLTVGDDGIGIQGAIDFGDVQTLGLRLVNTLVGQLKGTVELNRKDGTEFVIRY